MIFYNSIKVYLRVLLTGLAIGLAFFLPGCAQTKPGISKKTGPRPLPPDYSLTAHWAAHPGKYDPSDSLPEPYRPLFTDSSVDVFFLHPTSYLHEKGIGGGKPVPGTDWQKWNADVEDEAINRATDRGSILNQASVFNGYRVFAPRYRQAHIRAFYIADSLSKPLFDTAYSDIRSAFLYYMAHHNQGRPFIIASHSQGTLHAQRLICELIDGKPEQKQLVAAYLVGLPVRINLFTYIPTCTAPQSTGCIASWRTFKEGYQPTYVGKENFRAIVVNPLSWTIATHPVEREANQGAILYNFNKPSPNNVGAVIHGNILWSSKPRFFGNIFFTRKNYHIGDYNLFWKNIRENASLRVQAFKNSRPK